MSVTAAPEPIRLPSVDLAGAAVLITGGANGIGRAVAGRVAAAGAKVVLADVEATAGAAAAEELGGVFVRTDVTDLEAVRAAVAATEEAYGRLDVAFLNAGVSTGFQSLDEFDLEAYRRANGVNLDGVVFGVTAALPALRRAGGGAIVATASLAGLVGAPFDPVYCANKHAVVGLTRAMAPTLAADGISINCLCPGFAETRIITELREHLEAAGLPILPVDAVADAFVAAVSGGGSGEAWVIQPGREPSPYRFRGVPGPRA